MDNRGKRKREPRELFSATVDWNNNMAEVHVFTDFKT